MTQFIWSRLILRWYIGTTDVFTRYLGTLWAAPLPHHHFPRLPKWWPLPLRPGAISLIPILDKYKYIQIPDSTQLNAAHLTNTNADLRPYNQKRCSNLFLIIGIIHFHMKAVKTLPLLTFLIKCQSNVNHTDELRFSLESFQIKLLSTAFTSFLNSDLSSFSLRQIITIKAWNIWLLLLINIWLLLLISKH